jgi:hypothetical protein
VSVVYPGRAVRDSGSREISTATHLLFAPRGFGNFPRLDQAFAERHEIFLFGCIYQQPSHIWR